MRHHEFNLSNTPAVLRVLTCVVVERWKRSEHRPVRCHSTLQQSQALSREEDPLKLWAIGDEPALRCAIADLKVMREQYEELAELTRRDNVTIQILPAAVRGYVATHDLSIMHLGPGLPTAVQVDTAWNTVAVSDKPREVSRFNRMFDALVASALPPRETPEVLHQLVL